MIFPIPFFQFISQWPVTTIAYRAQCLQWQCKIACTWFFLTSFGVKLHTSFQTKLNLTENCTRIFFHCIGSTHVNVRTRFCFKNNARRVLRSPSARAGNTMAKRKRTITDQQNISPTAIYFFTETKIRFLFFGHNKKSVISLQIFIIHFSLRTVGPD